MELHTCLHNSRTLLGSIPCIRRNDNTSRPHSSLGQAFEIVELCSDHQDPDFYQTKKFRINNLMFLIFQQSHLAFRLKWVQVLHTPWHNYVSHKYQWRCHVHTLLGWDNLQRDRADISVPDEAAMWPIWIIYFRF